jgi:hypothetical protein
MRHGAPGNRPAPRRCFSSAALTVGRARPPSPVRAEQRAAAGFEATVTWNRRSTGGVGIMRRFGGVVSPPSQTTPRKVGGEAPGGRTRKNMKAGVSAGPPLGPGTIPNRNTGTLPFV